MFVPQDFTTPVTLPAPRPELIVKGRTGLAARFTPGGMLVSSDQDGTLELRDPTTLDVVSEVRGLPGPVIAPGFTSHGSLMVTTDDVTAAARLWDLAVAAPRPRRVVPRSMRDGRAQPDPGGVGPVLRG